MEAKSLKQALRRMMLALAVGMAALQPAEAEGKVTPASPASSRSPIGAPSQRTEFDPASALNDITSQAVPARGSPPPASPSSTSPGPTFPATSVASNELIEVHEALPVIIGGLPVRLDALLIKRADAKGRLPVALFTNVGVEATSGASGTSVDGYASFARDLARRGWLSVVAMRRGFGQSEGPKPVPVPCRATAFETWAAAAADDLQAVMNSVAQRPDADPDRLILIAAQSGGVAGVALAARNPRGLVGVINISGGFRSESHCPMSDILVDAFRSYGTKSRVPKSLDLCKDRSGIHADLADRMHAAFLDGGGDVKFVLFNRYFGPDQFPGLRWQWLMQIDAFLHSHTTSDLEGRCGGCGHEATNSAKWRRSKAHQEYHR